MADVALSVVGLNKSFGALVVCVDVSLELRTGEIHALIGPNGAGKSTLVKLVAGDILPDSGRVHLLGRDVIGLSTSARTRLGLGRTFQVSSILPDFTVRENVTVALVARSSGFPGVWSAAMRDSGLNGEADAMMALTGLTDQAEVRASDLAHAERRRVELAMVLALRPKVYLLDEPMAGLGLEGAGDVTDLLSDLRREAAVLLVEHDMDAVFRLADRISVLVSGRIIACGRPDEVRRDPEVQRAYLGDGYT